MFIFELELFSIGTINLLIGVVSSYKVNTYVEELTL
jgi:ABC-type lipoprotein release transport system permease subunit